MSRAFRFFGLTCWYALVVFLVVSAAALSAARLLLPRAHEYTQQVEQLLSGALNTPVRIGRLDAAWHRFGPQLVVRDVRVLNAAADQEIARFEFARLDFDLWTLVRDRQLGLSGVAISGVHLVIERLPEGQLRVAGISTSLPSESSSNTAVIEQWLFGRLQWRIEDSSVDWHDLRDGGAALHFSNVNLTLTNDGTHHRLEGRSYLPGDVGQQIAVGADIDGDPLQPNSWTGRFYVSGKNIELARIARELRDQSPLDVKTGLADFQLWSHWDGGLRRVSGDVGLRDVTMTNTESNARAIAITRLATRFQWERGDQNWTLNLDRFTLAREGRQWPESRALITVANPEPGGMPAIDAQFSFMRVDDLAALVAIAPYTDSSWREFAIQTRPMGDVLNVALRFNAGATHPRYKLRADVVGLSMAPWNLLPGFSGVVGELRADEKAGTLDLASDGAALELPKVFRGPLPMGGVHGRIEWTHDYDSGAWRVASDEISVDGADAEVRASVELSAPNHDTAPYLDLVATFKNGDGQHTSRYLPTTVMPPKVVEWIDNSVKTGTITRGGVILHGRVDRFPFHDAEGRFEVRGRVKDGVLNYMPDWPELRDIDADLVFSGMSMEVHGRSARILNSAVSNVFVTIPNMLSEYAILTVSGDVSGDTADQLTYLQTAPPLREKIGRNLSDLNVQGASDLHLDIAIPLGRSLDNDVKVAAFAKLRNNTLGLGSWGELLTHVDGMLAIDNDGVRGSRVSASVLDQPATLGVRTRASAQGAQVQIKSEGKLAPKLLMARYKTEWAYYFEGAGRWLANLSLPINSGASAVKKLHVEALWDDVQVKLPEPLGKPAGEPLFVEVNAEIKDAAQKLFVQYGNRVSTALQLVREQDSVKIARGELHFGDRTASIPRQTGVRVSGHVEKLSVDEWRTLVGDENWLRANSDPRMARAQQPQLLNDVDVHCNELVAFGQPLRDAHVKIVRGTKEWRATVNSTEFTGQVRVPDDLAQAPVVMDLDNWRYTPNDSDAKTTLDPRRLPAVQINSDKFMYGDVDFGRLELRASKFAFGWRVDKLELNAPLTMVNGSGAWTYDGKQHQSRFDMDVISEDIGKTMSTFGYADSISGGKGRINLHAAWPAALPDMAVENIDGKMTMEFKKGRMLDVNPGAGRMFALLSIQALPRRLALDFSDLFSKGFAFDEIKGEFRLEHGEAYTNNLAMDGPAAKVRAAGRVGLADRDYDQLVHVIPDLTGSVPTLTAIAAASPQVGVVTYVLGKIFQTQIDTATTVDYTLTGSWDNPQIARVSPAVVPNRSDTP